MLARLKRKCATTIGLLLLLEANGMSSLMVLELGKPPASSSPHRKKSKADKFPASLNDYSFTCPHDYFTKNRSALAVWPLAEKVLLPRPHEHLMTLFSTDLMMEAATLQLHALQGVLIGKEHIIRLESD